MVDKPNPPSPPATAAPEPLYLVPQALLSTILEIMQELPYQRVKNVMPALATCQVVTQPPKQP